MTVTVEWGIDAGNLEQDYGFTSGFCEALLTTFAGGQGCVVTSVSEDTTASALRRKRRLQTSGSALRIVAAFELTFASFIEATFAV